MTSPGPTDDPRVPALRSQYRAQKKALLDGLRSGPGTRGIRGALGRFGIGVSPDDVTLVLRGMETMGLRLQHAARVAMMLIDRLRSHETVDRVLYPALPDAPDHALWRRDFKGASGLFAVALRPVPRPALEAFFTIEKIWKVPPRA